MVPGKRYSPEDFLQIAWRRRWVILLPFLAVAAGSVVYSRSLPSLYKAETLILVVPQQVPRNYVMSTVTTQIDQRLQAISQQILSRARLEQLIQEFDLYPEQRTTALMEDVVQRMRDIDVAISIERTGRGAQSGTSFRVSYTSTNPLTAMRVTERLATMFVDANLKDRELLAEGTDQFIEAELIAARTRLEEQETALAEYRRLHPWDQAEQVEHNRWVMVNTTQAIEKVANALNQDRDRLLFLEKLLADLQSSSESAPLPSGGSNATGPVTAAAQLEAARSSLAALELRLKPEHPDVIKAQKVIAELTKKAEQEALSAPVSAEDSPTLSGTPQDKQRMLNTRNEIAVLKSRVDAGEQRERQLTNLLAEQQRRVESYPVRAMEMQALRRDYDVIRRQYHDLLGKKESAKIAANLERQQIGEQMRIVDPARQPQRPISPDRTRINLLGAALGLGLGLGLAALLEYRDTSLRTETDVVSALALPVLALVPVMETTQGVRRAKRRRLIWSVTGTVTLVMSAMAAVLWRLWS